MTFSSTEISSGRVIPVGRVIDPEQAAEIGVANRDMLYPAGSSRRQNKTARYGKLSLDHAAKTTDQLALLEGVGEILDKKVKDAGYSAEPSELDVMIGAANLGRWHVDRAGDMRMLVNLSERSVYLEYATEWDRRAWAELRSDEAPHPDEFERIYYGPGEGVLIDNMCNPVDLVPHRGSTQTGKLVLRAFAREL